MSDESTPFPDHDLVGRQKSGKAGGETTKERHGSDFFKKIGQKGGKAKKEKADEAP
jgi:hypothetical protein